MPVSFGMSFLPNNPRVLKHTLRVVSVGACVNPNLAPVHPSSYEYLGNNEAETLSCPVG